MVHIDPMVEPTLWLDYTDGQGCRSWREVVPLRVVLGPTTRGGITQSRYCLVVRTPEGERTLLMTSIRGTRASNPELAASLHVWEFRGAWHVVASGQDTPLYSCATQAGAEDWIHGYTGSHAVPENVHGKTLNHEDKSHVR